LPDSYNYVFRTSDEVPLIIAEPIRLHYDDTFSKLAILQIDYPKVPAYILCNLHNQF